MKISFLRLFLFAFLLIPNLSFAQIPFTIAVDDTLCVTLGDNFNYNVKDNDLPPSSSVPVILVQPDSSCVGLSPDGHLFFLADADASCCGLKVLRYRYEGCQPGQLDCEATIFFLPCEPNMIVAPRAIHLGDQLAVGWAIKYPIAIHDHHFGDVEWIVGFI